MRQDGHDSVVRSVNIADIGGSSLPAISLEGIDLFLGKTLATRASLPIRELLTFVALDNIAETRSHLLLDMPQAILLDNGVVIAIRVQLSYIAIR